MRDIAWAHIANFESLIEEMTMRNAVVKLPIQPLWAAQISALLNNDATREQMTEAAKNFSTEIGGAADLGPYAGFTGSLFGRA